MNQSASEKEIVFRRVDGKQVSGDIRNSENVKVGGREGSKSLVSVFLGGEKSRFAGKYFSKEYARNEEKNVDLLLKAYSYLKKKGIPVPNTVRKYISSQGNSIQLLMTDVTEGGKKIVWGFSDNMTVEQRETYNTISLSKENITKLSKIVDNIVLTATEAGIEIKRYNYHLVLDPVTKDTEVCILDIDPVLRSGDMEEVLLKKNASAGRMFMSDMYLLAPENIFEEDDY